MPHSTPSARSRQGLRASRLLLLGCLLGLLLAACGGQQAAAPPVPTYASELTFYNWAGDMPQSILDTFTKEYGIKVNYEGYETQEEALANLRAGKRYDVIVVANEHIPTLVQEGRLATLNFGNLPNFKNISANFRDLSYDPGNQHSVPYHWGTVGVIVREDLAKGGLKRWADLWKPEFAGKIGVRPFQRDLMGFSLLSLGYSVNSEDPAQLKAAEEQLLKLGESTVFVEVEAAKAVPKLLSGELVALVGWAEDALVAQEADPSIQYLLPEEGPVLWGDNFTIPANSQRKETAELFINFLLRPEMSAIVVNEKHYATPNAAANSFVESALRDNPVIFPPEQQIKHGHLMLALSPEGEKRHLEIWERFMAQKPQ